jgi:hypothetical protein
LLSFSYCDILAQQIVKGVPNFVLFSGGYAKPQKRVWINHNMYQGFVVNNSKDTLHGELKFIDEETALFRGIGEEAYKEKSLKDVYYIRLEGADTTFGQKQYTEFFRFEDISKHNILRKIGTNSGVAIYDNNLFVNEIAGYINTAYVVLEDEKTGRRKQFPNFWNGNTKRAMIRFYNEATGKKVSYSQFRNYAQFVRFLLAEK